jgi:rubrerythrin
MFDHRIVLSPDLFQLARRRALTSMGALTMSAGAIALLGASDALAAAKTKSSKVQAQDADILNTALGAELEAIAAYQLGAESGLLSKPVLDLAVQFQGHHKEHAAALAGAVKKLGATPVEAKKNYGFPTDKLKAEKDVVSFAAGLEKGAVSAYLGAVPIFGDRELARVAASILGDEAMHWAVLRQALGQSPVPSAFVS